MSPRHKLERRADGILTEPANPGFHYTETDRPNLRTDL